MITKCENRPESGCRACEYSQDRFDCRVKETKQVKHTPGPWLARQMFSGNWDICAEDGNGETIARAREESNARLIAAAPELLAALSQLLSRLAFYGSIDSVREEGPIEDARTAIRKAEGK
jgi:hypothetical protein